MHFVRELPAVWCLCVRARCDAIWSRSINGHEADNSICWTNFVLGVCCVPVCVRGSNDIDLLLWMNRWRAIARAHRRSTGSAQLPPHEHGKINVSSPSRHWHTPTHAHLLATSSSIYEYEYGHRHKHKAHTWLDVRRVDVNFSAIWYLWQHPFM